MDQRSQANGGLSNSSLAVCVCDVRYKVQNTLRNGASSWFSRFAFPPWSVVSFQSLIQILLKMLNYLILKLSTYDTTLFTTPSTMGAPNRSEDFNLADPKPRGAESRKGKHRKVETNCSTRDRTV